jgi:glycosyltransferase involved in cell wall biosynthesis
MNTRKKLSILIPTLNRVESVLTAIESIGAKNHSKIEIIVVDNCSSKDIYSELETKLTDMKNIKLYQNKSNIGMVKNFNECIKYATGEWLSLMCSDDQYSEGAVLRILKLIQKVKYPTLIIQDPTLKDELQNFSKGSETAGRLRLPIASGNIWHSEITKNLGGFDERIKYSPDAEFWPRIAYNYPVLKIKQPTAVYNKTDSNYGYKTWRKEDFLEQAELLSRVNCNYCGDLTESQKNKMVHQGINQTLITILYNTVFSKNERHLFKKYLKIFLWKNKNCKYWLGLGKVLLHICKYYRKR